MRSELVPRGGVSGSGRISTDHSQSLAVFCLATVEYGVPSLLQVDTFALEVFTLLNGYHDFTAAGRATLAPLVLVLGVAFLAARWLMPRLGPLLHPQGGASLRLHLPRGSHLSAFLLAMGLALGSPGVAKFRLRGFSSSNR